jgi:hypothetical protein
MPAAVYVDQYHTVAVRSRAVTATKPATKMRVSTARRAAAEAIRPAAPAM